MAFHVGDLIVFTGQDGPEDVGRISRLIDNRDGKFWELDGFLDSKIYMSLRGIERLSRGGRLDNPRKTALFLASDDSYSATFDKIVCRWGVTEFEKEIRKAGIKHALDYSAIRFLYRLWTPETLYGVLREIGIPSANRYADRTPLIDFVDGEYLTKKVTK